MNARIRGSIDFVSRPANELKLRAYRLHLSESLSVPRSGFFHEAANQQLAISTWHYHSHPIETDRHLHKRHSSFAIAL